MQIKTVGVLGCGLMGSGIAQVCATAGYRTIVREIDEAFLNKGLGRIRKFLEDGVAKGKVTADVRDTTLANLSGATSHGRAEGMRPGDRSDRREPRRKAAHLLCARGRDWCPDDHPVEHVVIVCHRAGGDDDPSRSLWRTAFFQSGSADEAGRSHSRVDDERRDLSDRICVRAVAGQGADHRSRSARLHRQPSAGAVPARCDPRLRKRPWHGSKISTRA